jgi:GNAT superfamily N-acetyltransferase
MYLRLGPGDFGRMQGEANRQAFHALVASGATPGIIAYVDGVPAGWCAVEPREAYPALARSRILKPVDDLPVWSVTCFFIHRSFRHSGLALRLLREAVAWARAHGAQTVEGYPVDPGEDRVSAASAWRGTADLFRAAGFSEVARRAPRRPIMRYATSAASE